MKYPPATRQVHRRFCQVEGWDEVHNARGGTGSHHLTYELSLPSGDVLRTRISHPPNRTEYGASLWSHILRVQLDVTEDEFWNAVRDGIPPSRQGAVPGKEPLPTDMVWQLKHNVGLTDTEIAEMTVKTAAARLAHYYTTGE